MIRKIMRTASRKTELIQKLTSKLPDFADINDFEVPQKYKIEGCYVESMSSLMDLSEATTSRACLQRLSEFRRSITKDLDHYYKSQKEGAIHL